MGLTIHVQEWVCLKVRFSWINHIYLFRGASRTHLKCGARKLFWVGPDNKQLQINAKKLEALTTKIVIPIFKSSWDTPSGKASAPFFLLTNVNFEMQQRKSLLVVEVAWCCCWGLVRNCYVYNTQVLFLPCVFRIMMVTSQNILQSILCIVYQESSVPIGTLPNGFNRNCGGNNWEMPKWLYYGKLLRQVNGVGLSSLVFFHLRSLASNLCCPTFLLATP